MTGWGEVGMRGFHESGDAAISALNQALALSFAYSWMLMFFLADEVVHGEENPTPCRHRVDLPWDVEGFCRFPS
jgi:hypothetical protein